MQNNKEERDIQQALGSVPKVYNQRAFSCTVTIAGTGLGTITVEDVRAAMSTQHEVIGPSNNTVDEMYVHKIRAYGTAGRYLSMAPYPHRQYCGNPATGDTISSFFNAYSNGNDEQNVYNRGSLTQMYEFGINGATRPELVWEYPKAEVINNPFILTGNFIDGALSQNEIQVNNLCKLLTLQSTNTGGNALYIVQFDVTIRNSRFVEIAPSLGGAAFGEENVLVDNYLPPLEGIKKALDGEKAEEQANKKRKIKAVKDLTMPTLDAK